MATEPKTSAPTQALPDHWFRRMTSHAAFSGVTTLLIVLAGAAASLFTSGIQTHLPFIPDASSQLGAVLFVLLVVASVGLLVANQFGLLRKSAQAHEELTGALDKLQAAQQNLDRAVKRLNTLPSETFLPAYKDQYTHALAATTLALIDPAATLGNVETAIRAVLAALVDTAKDYDNAQGRTIYAANVMLFRPRAEKGGPVGVRHLVPVGAGSVEYLGVLELEPALSVSSASAGAPDGATGAISVPVPNDPSDFIDSATGTTRLAVLPGAATSFCKGSFDAFNTIEAFLARLGATSIDLKQQQAIKAYFTSGEGRHIQSLASMPIFPLALPATGTSAATAALRPLGVINLHSHAAGLLSDNGEELFSPLMATFAALVAILLIRRQELLK